MEIQKIPLKNYIVAFLIAIITIILVLFLSNYYKSYQNYKEKNHTMLFLFEIKKEELDNFLTENHDIMIYLIDSSIYEEEIQNEVKEIINNNDYGKDMVALDIKENNEFLNDLEEKYTVSNLQPIEIKNNSLLFIKSGKIVKILNIDENNIDQLQTNIETYFYGEL